MPATLQFNLTGGAANSDPGASLGGVHSSVQVSAAVMNNIFDDVSPAEASAGDAEYRALDVQNVGDAIASSVTIYMSTETSSADTQIDMGAVASPINSTESVIDESTAPATVTFAHRLTGARLALPDIAAGSYCRVWLRRVVGVGATNTGSDQGTLAVDFA
jgi:hypothetical protein